MKTKGVKASQENTTKKEVRLKENTPPASYSELTSLTGSTTATGTSSTKEVAKVSEIRLSEIETRTILSILEEWKIQGGYRVKQVSYEEVIAIDRTIKKLYMMLSELERPGDIR